MAVVRMRHASSLHALVDEYIVGTYVSQTVQPTEYRRLKMQSGRL